MNRTTWQLTQWSQSLGIPGMTGLVLAVAAIALLFGLALPTRVKTLHNADTIAVMQHRVKAEQDHPADLPAVSSLTAFYQFFPDEKSAAPLLEKIYQAANHESLALTHGEYKFIREKSGHLGHYQIMLPVKGNYLQIRKFIAKVLNGMPMVSLDNVNFKRESIGGTGLEARIQFSLYLETT